MFDLREICFLIYTIGLLKERPLCVLMAQEYSTF